MKLRVAAACLLLCGCSGALDHNPRVIIDGDFTPAERAGIWDALLAWHNAVPEFTFREASLDHSELTGAALGEDFADSIYISRNDGPHDRSCPDHPREIGDDHVGVEETDGDKAVICIDATYVNTNGAKWKSIMMHELGHALGLGHSPAPSVMAPVYSTGAGDPTPDDIARLRSLWGI